ncbi:lysophospholipid acyltransferase family protein [Segnochrobactrum spirostomi]|uniref:lysophospholipid acyltransferase family protein n=1 Tax=Segnochrobactrum spirostomi TaxID=2608987 RepID=UPI001AD7E977|nr:lysophospholipid acyltransferase family protein [Segnochrobactrum spirostomi]
MTDESASSSAPRVTLLHRIEYGAVRAIAALIRALPLDVASALVGGAWALIAPLTKRQARALDNLRHAFPEKSEAELRRIAREAWRNLGRVMAETILLDRLVADQSRIAISDTLFRMRDRGREGGVFCTMHGGNWELGVLPYRGEPKRPWGVYQAVQNPLIDAWLVGLRADYYGALLPKSPATARKVLAHVKRGGAVGLVVDHREAAGIEVPFFGRPALATPYPAMLARTTGQPLFMVHTVRTEGSRFVLDGVEIKVPQTDDRTADIHAATAAIHALFEEWIRARPEQWMWAHRKWAYKIHRRGLMRRGEAPPAAPAPPPAG